MDATKYPQSQHLEKDRQIIFENAKLLREEKVNLDSILKEFSSIAFNCTIIENNNRSAIYDCMPKNSANNNEWRNPKNFFCVHQSN